MLSACKCFYEFSCKYDLLRTQVAGNFFAEGKIGGKRNDGRQTFPVFFYYGKHHETLKLCKKSQYSKLYCFPKMP